jgi:hypothetical protein
MQAARENKNAHEWRRAPKRQEREGKLEDDTKASVVRAWHLLRCADGTSIHRRVTVRKTHFLLYPRNPRRTKRVSYVTIDKGVPLISARQT